MKIAKEFEQKKLKEKKKKLFLNIVSKLLKNFNKINHKIF